MLRVVHLVGSERADLLALLGGLSAERIEITGRSGAPVVVVDEGERIDAILADLARDVADGPGRDGGATSRCGCDGVGGGAWAAAALALVARRRRDRGGGRAEPVADRALAVQDAASEAR